LLIGFLLGLSVDIFANTFGIHAFACTLTAFVRHFLLLSFAPKDDRFEIIPSISSFGLGNFFKYASLMVLVHHSALFIVDNLSFIHIGSLLLQILLSSTAVILILMLIEKFKIK
jgi:hypothetical protein